MFTLKFYSHGDAKMKIFEAESVTILRDGDTAEVSMHRKDGTDSRLDVTRAERLPEWPDAYDKVIIENAVGKTTEIIHADPTIHKIAKAA